MRKNVKQSFTRTKTEKGNKGRGKNINQGLTSAKTENGNNESSKNIEQNLSVKTLQMGRVTKSFTEIFVSNKYFRQARRHWPEDARIERYNLAQKYCEMTDMLIELQKQADEVFLNENNKKEREDIVNQLVNIVTKIHKLNEKNLEMLSKGPGEGINKICDYELYLHKNKDKLTKLENVDLNYKAQNPDDALDLLNKLCMNVCMNDLVNNTLNEKGIELTEAQKENYDNSANDNRAQYTNMLENIEKKYNETVKNVQNNGALSSYLTPLVKMFNEKIVNNDIEIDQAIIDKIENEEFQKLVKDVLILHNVVKGKDEKKTFEEILKTHKKCTEKGNTNKDVVFDVCCVSLAKLNEIEIEDEYNFAITHAAEFVKSQIDNKLKASVKPTNLENENVDKVASKPIAGQEKAQRESTQKGQEKTSNFVNTLQVNESVKDKELNQTSQENNISNRGYEDDEENYEDDEDVEETDSVNDIIQADNNVKYEAFQKENKDQREGILKRIKENLLSKRCYIESFDVSEWGIADNESESIINYIAMRIVREEIDKKLRKILDKLDKNAGIYIKKALADMGPKDFLEWCEANAFDEDNIFLDQRQKSDCEDVLILVDEDLNEKFEEEIEKIREKIEKNKDKLIAGYRNGENFDIIVSNVIGKGSKKSAKNEANKSANQVKVDSERKDTNSSSSATKNVKKDSPLEQLKEKYKEYIIINDNWVKVMRFRYFVDYFKKQNNDVIQTQVASLIEEYKTLKKETTSNEEPLSENEIKILTDMAKEIMVGHYFEDICKKNKDKNFKELRDEKLNKELFDDVIKKLSQAKKETESGNNEDVMQAEQKLDSNEINVQENTNKEQVEQERIGEEVKEEKVEQTKVQNADEQVNGISAINEEEKAQETASTEVVSNKNSENANVEVVTQEVSAESKDNENVVEAEQEQVNNEINSQEDVTASEETKNVSISLLEQFKEEHRKDINHTKKKISSLVKADYMRFVNYFKQQDNDVIQTQVASLIEEYQALKKETTSNEEPLSKNEIKTLTDMAKEIMVGSCFGAVCKRIGKQSNEEIFNFVIDKWKQKIASQAKKETESKAANAKKSDLRKNESKKRAKKVVNNEINIQENANKEQVEQEHIVEEVKEEKDEQIKVQNADELVNGISAINEEEKAQETASTEVDSNKISENANVEVVTQEVSDESKDNENVVEAEQEQVNNEINAQVNVTANEGVKDAVKEKLVYEEKVEQEKVQKEKEAYGEGKEKEKVLIKVKDGEEQFTFDEYITKYFLTLESYDEQKLLSIKFSVGADVLGSSFDYYPFKEISSIENQEEKNAKIREIFEKYPLIQKCILEEAGVVEKVRKDLSNLISEFDSLSGEQKKTLKDICFSDEALKQKIILKEINLQKQEFENKKQKLQEQMFKLTKEQGKVVRREQRIARKEFEKLSKEEQRDILIDEYFADELNNYAAKIQYDVLFASIPNGLRKRVLTEVDYLMEKRYKGLDLNKVNDVRFKELQNVLDIVRNVGRQTKFEKHIISKEQAKETEEYKKFRESLNLKDSKFYNKDLEKC